MKNILVLIILLFSIDSFSDELKPFTSDGCSMFPDGKLFDESKWVKCCIEHDLAYWKGGAEIERKTADLKLRKCVESVGEKSISAVMHLGVKIGGSPVYPTWYRWGYGWPYKRGYKTLTKDEKIMVNQRLLELRELIDQTVIQVE